MITKIKGWLNNPDKTFEDGLAIYEKVKKDTKKDAFFRTAPTFKQGTIQFNILASELTRICRILEQSQPESKAKIATAAQQLPSIKINPTANKKNLQRAAKLTITDVDLSVKYDDLPDEMKGKYDRIRELSKTLGGLKLMLETVPTDAERQQVADSLCTSYDERRDLWIALDEWSDANNGVDQGKNDKKKPSEMSVDELKKEIKLRNDNINRANKGINDKNRDKTKKKIQSWISEIDELNQLVNKANASA